MSKNVKIIIIIAVAALVIGVLIYFYQKNKKKAEAEKTAAKPSTPTSPIKKRIDELKAAGTVVSAAPAPTNQATSTA